MSILLALSTLLLFLDAYWEVYFSRCLLHSVLNSLLAAKCTYLAACCEVYFSRCILQSTLLLELHDLSSSKVLVKFISLSSTQTAAIVLGIFISPRLDSTLKENTLQNETLQYYSSHLLWAQKGDACCVVSLCVLVGSMPVCL